MNILNLSCILFLDSDNSYRVRRNRPKSYNKRVKPAILHRSSDADEGKAITTDAVELVRTSDVRHSYCTDQFDWLLIAVPHVSDLIGHKVHTHLRLFAPVTDSNPF